MTSALTMTSGRNNSTQRRLLGLTSCKKNNSSFGYSGSPLLNSSDLDFEPVLKQDYRKSDVDDNNRSASDYLSKLLNSRDFSNDLEGSPSTLSNSEANGFSYVPMKSNSSTNTRSSSVQKSSVATQKRNNRSSHKHKPAEVFRKDLISAMKLPDNSQLLQEEYWVMQDPWRIEWEKGVQVPVNQKAIPSRQVQNITKQTYGDFRMPRKMVKSSPEPGDKEMVDYNILADSTCRYDLDELDVHWLKEVNLQRKLMGLKPLDEFSMEQIMEELEVQCHENLQLAIQTKEGLGIEYDENVVCDVCRSLDCEEGNEMVFCDGCNLCVHQACYGILKVPEGSWLCKLCTLGIRSSTVCILCNRKGGAMKSTRSGNKWAHVSCALWIPEISITDPERMEPITKVSLVPASRWALVCSICKERVGACIQCSVKHCVTAYHVTCAIEAKLDMEADCGSSDSEDESVIFKSFCKKHSTRRKGSDVEDDEQSEEEKRSHRQRRIMELEEEFYTQVKASSVASTLSVPCETAAQVMLYWKLKRRANFNKPLITPKNEEDTALAEAAETNLQRRLRMFTHLRQDLERVRNLCYMIGRREKTKRASVKNMESVFLTQMKVLERRMCEELNYDSVRMVPFLRKFGKPEVCNLAHKESVILAKSKEWSQNADDSDKTDSSVQALKDETSTRKTDFKTSVKDANNIDVQTSPEKPQQAADMLKNGLHRKAFASACQKREVLLRRGRRKTSHQDSNSASKEHLSTSAQRKRSLHTNSESDVDQPATNKKRRLEKSQSWTRWQETKKAPDPSKREENSTAALSSKTNRASTRRTRSTSIISDASVPNSDTSDRALVGVKTMHHDPSEPQLTRNESHLIVKWDSDKNNDTPDILEKSTVGRRRKLSLAKEDKVTSKTKPEIGESSGSERSTPLARRTLRTSAPSEKAVREEEKTKKKTQFFRTPHRQSSKTPKNDSGAPALSRDPPTATVSHPSSEQGLPRQDESTSSSKLADKRRRHSSEVDSRKDERRSSVLLHNLSSEEDEEDRGYRGDMDESDIDIPSHRHKTALPRHRSHKDALPLKSTDTSESCYGESQKRLSPRKRRLKSTRSRTLPERKESLVSFQGFKDLEDESAEPEAKSPRKLSKPENVDVEKSPKESPNFDAVVKEKSPVSIEPITMEATPAVNLAVESPKENPDIESTVLSARNDSALPEAGDPFEENKVNDISEEVNGPSELAVALTEENALTGSGMYDSFQNYQAAYYNPQMYASHGSMVNMSIQQTFFYQQYYPYWQQPPPPPPPPPDDDPPEENQEPAEQLVSQESTNFTIPEAPLDSASTAQCNQHFDNLQVQYFPTFSDQLPNVSEVPAHPDISSLGDSIESHSKKKQKKSKKKKKKKKRKRKHSRMNPESGNEIYSSASSGYDEWGFEYCCTLVHNEPVDQAQSPFSESVPFEAAQPIVTLNDLEPEPSPLGIESEAPTETKKESKLLLKIDKSKYKNSPPVKESSSSVSSDEDAASSNDAKLNKPYITPLKLKLCGQKSDRTLRGGLVAREYQILESNVQEDSNLVDPSPHRSGSKQSIASHSAKEAKSSSFVSKSAKSKVSKAPNKTTKTTQKKSNSKKHTVSKSPAQAVGTSNSGTSIPSSKTFEKIPGPQTVQTKQPSTIPERHWKKRKLHVHEASVTTNANSGGKSPIKKASLTSSSIPTSSITNHSSKPTEDESKSPGINHASSLVKKDGFSNVPAKSITKPTQPRRKKTSESNKTFEKASKFSSSLPPVSPYKFTVPKTHQKILSSGSGETPDKDNGTNSQSDAVKSKDDPYAFADFGEM